MVTHVNTVRGLGGATMVGVAACLAWLAPIPASGEGEGPAQGQGAAAVETAEAVATVMQSLDDGTFDAKAEETAKTKGLVAAGDTCAMRRPNLMPKISDAVRGRFLAASLSDNPANKRLLLTALAKEPEAHVRKRAHIGLARLALRTGNTEEADKNAQSALDAPLDGLETCDADAWFILSRTAPTPTATEAALRKALELDPGHLTARFDAIPTLVRAAEQNIQGAEACADRVALLMDAVVTIDQLARDGDRLGRLANSLGTPNSPARALTVGVIYERLGRREAAGGIYRAVAQQPAADACAHALRDEIERRAVRLAEEVTTQ